MTAYSSPEYVSAQISHFTERWMRNALTVEHVRRTSGFEAAAWTACIAFDLSIKASPAVVRWIEANVTDAEEG